MTEILGLAGMGLMLAAVWLQWTLPERLSHMEERYKEAPSSAERLQHRIRRARLAPIVCTLSGFCLMAGAALRLMR
ncbi:MAG: hypothetical protein ACHQ4G_06935 [Opitutales bacterium]